MYKLYEKIKKSRKKRKELRNRKTLKKKILKSIKKENEITGPIRKHLADEMMNSTPRGKMYGKILDYRVGIDPKDGKEKPMINQVKLANLIGRIASKELKGKEIKLTPNQKKLIGLKGVGKFLNSPKGDDKKSDDDSDSDDEDYYYTEIEKRKAKEEHEKWKVSDKYLEEIDERLKKSYGHGDTLKDIKYSGIETIPEEEGKIGGKKKGKTRRRKRNRKKSTRRRKRRGGVTSGEIVYIKWSNGKYYKTEFLKEEDGWFQVKFINKKGKTYGKSWWFEKTNVATEDEVEVAKILVSNDIGNADDGARKKTKKRKRKKKTRKYKKGKTRK